MRASTLVLAAGVIATSVTVTGCAEMNQYLKTDSAAQKGKKPKPPAVKVASIKIAHAPTEAQLATHYCLKLTKAELGELAEIGCSYFGKEPKKKDLQFAFDIDIEAQNPSPIPLPLAQVLVAFTVFPNKKPRAGKQALGAICLSMCKDPKNCEQKADACKSTEPEIHDLESFAWAAASFLVSVAVGEKKFEDLKVQTIPPGKAIHFNTRLALDIDQMDKILFTVASDAIKAIQKKKKPHIVIPYNLEGAAWVTVESFGRIGSNIPIYKGEWDLAKL
jgi:hypothetical protein